MAKNFGKDELFTQLYDTYNEPVRRYLRSRGVAEELLDDVTHDAFERLYYRICSRPDRPIVHEKLVGCQSSFERREPNVVSLKERPRD